MTGGTDGNAAAGPDIRTQLPPQIVQIIPARSPPLHATQGQDHHLSVRGTMDKVRGGSAQRLTRFARPASSISAPELRVEDAHPPVRPRLLGSKSRGSIQGSQVAASHTDLWSVLKEECPDGTAEAEAVNTLARDFAISARARYAGLAHTLLCCVSVAVAVTNFVAELEALDIALSGLTAVLMVLTVYISLQRYYKEQLWRADYSGRYPHLVTSPLLPPLLVQLALTAVHAPAFLAGRWGPAARTLNCAVLLRTMSAMRAMAHFTRIYRSSGGSLVGAVTGETIGPFFVYKMLLFQHPTSTVCATVGVGYILLSCMVWFAEGSWGDWTLWDALWFTMVTFTTVGYGDLVPSTVVGRIVGMLTALFGIIGSAVLVSVVQHQLNLSRQQKQMIMFLCEVQQASALKEAAAAILVRLLHYRRVQNQWIRETGEPVPPHRSAATPYFSTSPLRKQLHWAWRGLRQATMKLRRIRMGQEAGIGWADISVLDVLHADTSDVLAQNTVLQYLMRPADDELSAQLRRNRPRSMAPRRNSHPRREPTGPPETPRSVASGAETPQREPSVPTLSPQALLPASTVPPDPPAPAERSPSSPAAPPPTLQQQQQPQQAAAAAPPAGDVPSTPRGRPVSFRRPTKLPRGASASSLASRGSVVSTSSGLRTAQFTRGLVDMLKQCVADPGGPGSPAHTGGITSPPHHHRMRRSVVGQQPRRESLGRVESTASDLYAALAREDTGPCPDDILNNSTRSVFRPQVETSPTAVAVPAGARLSPRSETSPVNEDSSGARTGEQQGAPKGVLRRGWFGPRPQYIKPEDQGASGELDMPRESERAQPAVVPRDRGEGGPSPASPPVSGGPLGPCAAALTTSPRRVPVQPNSAATGELRVASQSETLRGASGDTVRSGPADAVQSLVSELRVRQELMQQKQEDAQRLLSAIILHLKLDPPAAAGSEPSGAARSPLGTAAWQAPPMGRRQPSASNLRTASSQPRGGRRVSASPRSETADELMGGHGDGQGEAAPASHGGPHPG